MTTKMVISEALEHPDGSTSYVVEVNDYDADDAVTGQRSRTPFEFAKDITTDDALSQMRAALSDYLDPVEPKGAKAKPRPMDQLMGTEL